MDALDELQSKYNKLASEYSKLRAQIPVLKKAFTEEQSKNNSLCEEVKSKDQQLRIAESEADSLNFRNQQLMCRVTVLQDELETLQNSYKKDVKSKNFDGPQFLHNFDEELSKKVAENATLIFTLNEYKERHELEVKALKDEIEALKLNKFKNEDEDVKKSQEVSSQANGSSHSHKNMIGETIQKALEKQLFETQQTLQRTIAERDKIKQKLKLHEDNLKNGFIEFNMESESEQTVNSCLNSGFEHNPDSPVSDSENDVGDNSVRKEGFLKEQTIKQFYRRRNEKLIADKMLFKSRADTYEEECKNLKNRLEQEVLLKKSLEELLEKEKLCGISTKEELNTTTENYEIQLSTMSDHLAGLNDIIEEQKNQLDTLQTELQKHSTHRVKK